MVDPINPLRREEARRRPVDYHVRFKLEDGHCLMQLPVLQELGHDLERQTSCKSPPAADASVRRVLGGRTQRVGFRLWVSRGVSSVRYITDGREKKKTRQCASCVDHSRLESGALRCTTRPWCTTTRSINMKIYYPLQMPHSPASFVALASTICDKRKKILLTRSTIEVAHLR